MEKKEIVIQSQTIDWLRVLMILFVVMSHLSERCSPDMKDISVPLINLSEYNGMSIYYIFRLFVDTIKGICIPAFFLFSGYLFFINIDQWDKYTYLEKLKKRVFTLLIPYFLWNIISILFQFFTIFVGRICKHDNEWFRLSDAWNEIFDKGILNVFWHYTDWGGGRSGNVFGWYTQSMGPYNSTMWFLQTLICLTIITPIIYIFVKKLHIYGVILLGILYNFGIWQYSVPGFNISGVFFFTLGAYLGINKKNMVFVFRRMRYVIFPLTVIFLLSTVVLKHIILRCNILAFNYTCGIFCICGVISAFIIVSYLIEKKKLRVYKTISSSTFFIYAAHTCLPVLGAVEILFEFITFKSKNWLLLSIAYFMVPVIAAIVCICILLSLKKFMPSVAKILSGNRF